jgi:styrene monooxygenase A-like protein
MDCWADVKSPEEHLKTTLRIFEQFFPWEAERHAEAELTDDNAWLSGAVPPLVRKPIGRLPSGRAVVGMADVVVLNDPCTGQGANNASHHAALFHRLITEHGDRPFDEAWMQRTFDEYWSYAQWPTMFTNAMMQPPPEHVVDLLGAAMEIQEVANRITNCFDDPTDLQHFFFDPEKANAYLAEVGGRWEGFRNDRKRLFGWS